MPPEPLTSERPQPHAPHRAPRRPAWRERLVQAERGLVGGVRSDSTFFVHFFGASIVLAASGVLGLARMQWAIVLISLTIVLCAEIFDHALRAIVADDQQPQSPGLQRVLGLGSAAVMLAMASAAVVIGLTFWDRVAQMFQG